MHPSPLWYLSRGTGAVTLLLLTAVVLLGVGSMFRWRSERLPKFLVHGLHRNLTLLTLAFLSIHVLSAVADPFAPIRLADAVLPFASAYRPVWLGLGAVALDLLLALTLTSLLRARVGVRLWRGLHWLAYAAWPVAVLHGLGTGTDARAGWLQLLTAACTVAVAGAVVARAARGRGRGGSQIRLAGATAAVALPALAFVWALGGPLAAGWARKAGTPSSLLTASPPASPVAATSPSLPAAPFEARFAGSLAESTTGDGETRVALRARTTSGPSAILRIDLIGFPLSTGGVQLTASSVSLGPPGALDEYTGSVAALDGGRLLVALRSSSGRRVDLSVALALGGTRITGILRADPAGDDVEGPE